MAYEIHSGDTAEWNWRDGTGSGKVTERFTSKVSRTINGNDVTRDASDDEAASLIEQDDGDRVLTSSPELS